MSEAKSSLSALLDRVRAGESVLIVDRGRPIARLEPLRAFDDGDARISTLERQGLVRRGTGDAGKALSGRLARVAPGHERSAVRAVVEERREGR
ncbi:MAG: type II toxin-antitoxin system Phd/YefM family antitoxin [Acidimicrobiales bacterium]